MHKPNKLKSFFRYTFTLNDNKTPDLVAILCTIVIVIGCAVFGGRAVIKDEKPDYLNFFGGIATVIAASGLARNRHIGDPDTTKEQ